MTTIALFIGLACKQEFVLLPTVTLDDPSVNLDSIKVTARFDLEGVDSSRILRAGISWGLDETLIHDNDAGIDFTELAFSQKFFSRTVSGLDLNTVYYFQAYLLVKDIGYIVSNVRHVSSGDIFLSTSFATTGERAGGLETVQLNASVSGLRVEEPVDSFGHFWITRETTTTEDFDLITSDGRISRPYAGAGKSSFTYTDIVELDPGLNHYVRPYVVYRDTVRFGESVRIFIGNVWDKSNLLLPSRLTNAASFVIDDKAYIVTGSKNRNFHLRSQYYTGLIIFDALNDTIYTDVQDPFPGTPRIDAVAFTLRRKGYVGSGRSVSDDLISTPLLDFWEYDPDRAPGDRWSLSDTLLLPVFDAVAVVVGTGTEAVAFVGTGNKGTDNTVGFQPTGAMCVYSDTGWVAGGFPFNVPLSSAVAWTIEEMAFIGTGHRDNFTNPHVEDIWQGSDLVNNSGFAQMTEPFGGVARQSAVAFVIDRRMYVGTGSNVLNGAVPSFRDFYVFDLDRPERAWVEVDNLGDALRCNATAFTIGDRGYVCGGLTLDTQADPSVASDIWEYIPNPK